PDRGTIRFKGRDITSSRSHEIIRFGIARTFQNVELCRSMTALENLLVGQHVAMRGGVIRDGLRLPGVGADEARATQRADEMLELEAYYGRVVALHSVSLEVAEGSVATLLGANGAGKTTTLRVISGLLRPTRGSVEFDGKRIDGFGPDRLVRAGIVQVPEGRQ